MGWSAVAFCAWEIIQLCAMWVQSCTNFALVCCKLNKHPILSDQWKECQSVIEIHVFTGIVCSSPTPPPVITIFKELYPRCSVQLHSVVWRTVHTQQYTLKFPPVRTVSNPKLQWYLDHWFSNTSSLLQYVRRIIRLRVCRRFGYITFVYHWLRISEQLIYSQCKLLRDVEYIKCVWFYISNILFYSIQIV